MIGNFTTKKQILAILPICLLLFSGCQKGDDETKKQLAALQEQIAQQQKQENERIAREREQQQAEREKAIAQDAYNLAQEDLKMQQQLENEKKTDEAAKQKQATTSKKVVEKLARYPAFVISESGYGQVNLRGAPSASAAKVVQLNDGDQVQVVAKTNACTQAGCWVKVQVNGITGYVNEGYLQKGIAPQTNGSNDDDSGYPEDY